MFILQVLTYVAEIAEPNVRGWLCSSSSLTTYLGVFTQFLLGTFFYWRTVAAINVAVPICCILILFIIPESPQWLISKNRYDDARKSLAWLRGWTTEDEIEEEFQELCRNLEKETIEEKKTSKLMVVKKFGTRAFLHPFFLISVGFYLMHFTGQNVLQTYAVQIFLTMESPIDKYYSTLILGIVELLGSLFCSIMIHYTGKRPLVMFSTMGAGVCYIAVATYAYLNDINYLITGEVINSDATHKLVNSTSNAFDSTNSTLLLWLPTTILFVSAFVIHSGIRTIPWVLVSEFYSYDLRNYASGLSGAIAYVFSFLSNKTFLTMNLSWTLPGTFLYYAASGIVGSIVMYFTLPETEGWTLFDIENHFNGKCKLSKSKKKKSSEEGTTNTAFSETENV